MNPDLRSHPAGTSIRNAPSWPSRLFAGVTWRGIVIILLVCFVNGARRKIPEVVDSPLSALVGETLQLTALGLLIAVPVASALVVTWNLAPAKPWLRYPLLAMAVALSSAVGVAAHLYIDVAVLCGGTVESCYGGEPWPVAWLRSWVRYGTIAALASAVFVYLRMAASSAEHALDAEAARARFTRQLEEARLRVLQAQIEPHFLFNTLANVRRLFQTDPADADAMLDNLMRYLEIALPQMRATTSTLGREAALCESYLTIQRIRMGPRLEFAIDIEASLRDAPLPPMMLLTLVENAIKHGVAKLPGGGAVRIGAARAGVELRVWVTDTGPGFTQTSGTGTGLANIRARLLGLYGTAGNLTLSRRSPHGVTVTITVPRVPTSTTARAS